MKYAPEDLYDKSKIIYENENFLLHVDPKNTKDNFHYTAWCKKDIRSLIEITNKFTFELIKLEKEVKEIINESYVSYIHFPPNFWRLHIHFVSKENFKRIEEKDNDIYLLKDVIEKVKKDKYYFLKNVTLRASI